MVPSLGWLAAIAIAFVATHIAGSSRPLRQWFIARMGERGFRVAYSVIAIGLLAALVAAYNAAPVIAVWTPPTALRHLSLAIMPVACILLIGGVTSRNPTALGTSVAGAAAAGPAGIFKVTRHPVMWSIALWGISHLFANGTAADMLLFGAMTILALFGAMHLDRRKLDEIGATWADFRAASSFVPFAAWIGGRTRLSWRDIGWRPVAGGIGLYAAMLFSHRWVFGVDPLSVG